MKGDSRERGKGLQVSLLEGRKGAAGWGAGERGAVSSLLGEMDSLTHALESPPTRTCNLGRNLKRAWPDHLLLQRRRRRLRGWTLRPIGAGSQLAGRHQAP